MEKISVTDSEVKILELLWSGGEMSMRQIQQGLEEETGWTKHTVISLLKRMQQKGTAAVVEGSSPMRYVALVSREMVVEEQTKSLAKRLFGGNVSRMISTLVQREELSDGEIDELMKLLREANGKRHG